jgi:hypothetical protein
VNSTARQESKGGSIAIFYPDNIDGAILPGYKLPRQSQETKAMTAIDAESETNCIAFDGKTRLASGGLADVALCVKAALDADLERQILVFDAHTSRPIDFDLRGDAAAIVARLQTPAGTAAPDLAERAEVRLSAGPGRPKLGVVAREVTLLPRHWDWLGKQPGGASVTLRKLVEAARRSQSQQDDRREALESAYRFMSAMAGDEIGFEEASRALFAKDHPRLRALIANWPVDLRDHIDLLAQRAIGDANETARLPE